MAYSVKNGTSRQHHVRLLVFCVSYVQECILDEFRSLMITAFIFVLTTREYKNQQLNTER